MRHFDRAPFRFAPPLREGRSLRLLALLAPFSLAAALGCGDDVTSPVTDAIPQVLATASSQSLVFSQVSAGGSHTCGLTQATLAYCWGLNTDGQIGDGTHINRAKPTLISGGLKFVQISAGYAHTCGLTTADNVYCWGADEDGRLGDGTLSVNRSTPVLAGGGRRFARVRAGTYHTCAVNASDVAFCWGSNNFGELGDKGAVFESATPVRVVGGLRFNNVAAGGSFTCGVTTGHQAYCWGYNRDRNLGDGTSTQRTKPVAVLGGLSFRDAIAGGSIISDAQGTETFPAHACGVTTDNKAYCWGSDYTGQLGNHQSGNWAAQPVAVSGGLKFRQVVASDGYTCGVTTASVAYCWGDNQHGQLGIGSGSFYTDTPVKVAGGLSFTGVSAGPGGDHTCGITSGHAIYCWGVNTQGQLGDGTTTGRTTPVAVVGP
jgi:alpha-tubulin suppressor-like RCC1 family protein